MSNKDRAVKIMSINVNAQAMRYNGKPAHNIQNTIQEKMIPPGQEAILPVHIPFSVYSKFMVGSDSMKVSAMAFDKKAEDAIYETETDIALEDPAVSIKVVGEARVFRTMIIEVEFTNPLNEWLRDCSMTVIGCGLFRSDHIERNFRQLEPNGKLKLKITTTPYRPGLRTVVADFDCSTFRDVKGSCTIDIKP